MMIDIAPLAIADRQAVEDLLDAAFGSDRHMRTAYRIRQGMPMIETLSFAAFEHDRLVGTIQSWPVAIGEAPLVLVGPVAVAPTHQRTGIGRTLMNHLIEAAPETAMAMIGDPEYYGRFFAFTAEMTAGWDVPGPVERHRLLARRGEILPRRGMLGPRTFALAAGSD